ncbi:MAG: hypothetical protein ACXWYP_03970 [Pseudonocardia sp.]
MRTVSGFGRQFVRLVSRLVPRRSTSVAGFRTSATATAGRPLLTDRLGPQRHAGAVLDQVDGTTCGSAVLVALAAWAGPEELTRLEASATGQPLVGWGFGARYDARQKQVHRQTNRFWPQALGTTPWGAVRWLRDHVPAAGRHRVRLVDDTSAADVAELIEAVGAALAAGRPVPLLVGASVPRHYVLATRAGDGGWRVYEPTSGQVRLVDLAAVRERRLGPLLGFDRLHAALLPS